MTMENGAAQPAEAPLDLPAFELPKFINPPLPQETNRGDMLHDKDVTIDDDVFELPLFRVAAIPVMTRRRTAGGIYLPGETLDVQNWTHMLYKIVKLGPHIWRGPAFRHYDITEEELPKVGELWLIDPKSPRRFLCDNSTVVVVSDDALFARVNPEKAHLLKFPGLVL